MAIEAHDPYNLSDADCLVMCKRYANLERNLGEIDRARAIYIHASSLCNPATEKQFWEEWNQFEIKHGNEDTFREMRRIKRSVAASYSQMHFNTVSVEAAIPLTGEQLDQCNTPRKMLIPSTFLSLTNLSVTLGTVLDVQEQTDEVKITHVRAVKLLYTGCRNC